MRPAIGFAIVGTGMIAEVHAQAIQLCQDARLIGVFSRNRENCAAFAARWNTVPFESLETLIRHPDVQAVSVTTPSGAHAETAIPALLAGKSVLCEKPVEISLSAVDRMLQAEKDGNGRLAGVFQMRLGTGARLLRQAIEQGRFGKLSFCSAHIKWWRDYSYYTSSPWKGTLHLDGGGALINQGIHAVDLLQWLVGLPQEVAAFTATVAHSGIEAEDTVAASLRFPNGALGVIEAATSTFPGTDLRIEIMGDNGSAILVNDRITRWEFRTPLPGDDTVTAPPDGPSIAGGTGDAKKVSLDGHRLIVQDLAEAIRENRPAMTTGADARNAVALVRAIYASAQSGRRESVDRGPQR